MDLFLTAKYNTFLEATGTRSLKYSRDLNQQKDPHSLLSESWTSDRFQLSYHRTYGHKDLIYTAASFFYICLWTLEVYIWHISIITCHFRPGKKTLCNEPVSTKKNGKLPSSAVPPPIPMSPIVEKMEGLRAIRNRSNSLRLGRLAFYRHLEKVETMRSFWELKHVEMEQGKQQVTCSLSQRLEITLLFCGRFSRFILTNRSC